MTTITEIVCEKCLRSLISSDPANQTQGITTFGFLMTKCKHFYHQSCIKELYNTSTTSSPNSQELRSFICQRQNCAKPVKHDQIFLIVPNLRNRTIDSAGSSRPDENLKRALKIAQDTINEVKKMAQRSADELTIARNQNLELEKKLKELNALYRKSILDKICKVVHQRSTQTDTNTEVLLATSEMPKGNTKPKSIRTLDVANDESSELQAQSCANAAALLVASEPVAKQPTKTTTKQQPITAVNQIPKTITSQTPKSTTNQLTNTNALSQTTTYIPLQEFVPNFEPLILSTIDQTSVYQIPEPIASPIPKSTAINQNTNYNVPSQTTTYGSSLGISKIPANKETDEKRGSKRKNPASIARSYSPPKKPFERRPTEQTRERHLQFQNRFDIDSEILKPFYPLDCYPLEYTAAGVYYRNEVPKIAILAKDVLMIGDGLVYGMVQLISKAIPFQFDLHPTLYRRDLGIADLVRTLNGFPKLPPRIMLSIGNWDAFNSTNKHTFHNRFQKLLGILRSRRVDELYLIPPIRYTTPDSATFAYIVSLFEVDRGKIFGGQYMVQPTPVFQNPIVDEFGPKFELDQFESYVRAVRERFITPAADNHSDDEVTDSDSTDDDLSA
ncbi:uncharacterized protein LOC135846572 [Planococcus citri]|uniref:uncharacterized protein LOC135846572 n=1 Tax=Planococcus citri TaxID=170843 RepID=UPI0031F809EA